MSEPVVALLEQDAAIYDYLDSLLREIPSEIRREGAPPTDGATLAAGSSPVGAAPPPRIPTPGPTPARAAGEPPAWARPDFQALLFQVGRLNLAVPLVTLQSVVPWDADRVSAMPRQPDWVHGLMRYRERNVTVVDTERLVLPADRQAAGEGAAPGQVLVVGDAGWGLACRTLGEVIRLRPDEVKWRGAGGQRPWLAGTVLGRLCALMDTGAFADMLQQGSVAGAAGRADRRARNG